MRRATAGTHVRLAAPLKIHGVTLPAGTTGVIARDIGDRRGPEVYDTSVRLDDQTLLPKPPNDLSDGVEVNVDWSELEPA